MTGNPGPGKLTLYLGIGMLVLSQLCISVFPKVGLGISELFLQIWNETGCFHGQIWRRRRICHNI